MLTISTAGFSANSYWGSASHNKPNDTPFTAKESEVDMLLNVDERKLDLCIVGHNDDKHHVKFWSLPIGQNGWVPHFNVYYNNTILRIATISPSLFGKQKKNVFK